jgi:hypothetical protein
VSEDAIDEEPEVRVFALNSDGLPHLYLLQVARAYRALGRFRDAICANPDSSEYYEELDDCFHVFFQTSWHVKDWLYNDETVDHATRVAATVDAEKERPIRIAADIANRAKHLVLQGDRTGADSNTIQMVDCGPGRHGLMFVVELRDGTKATALELMSQVMDSWHKIFTVHRLPTIRSVRA